MALTGSSKMSSSKRFKLFASLTGAGSNLPHNQSLGEKRPILHSSDWWHFAVAWFSQKAAIGRLLPVIAIKRGSQPHTNACSARM